MYHHRVPSFGNLAPGIPGVVDSKLAHRVTSLLPIVPDLLNSCLYACLRLDAGSRKLPAVLSIARDFSPRVMVASERDVLVDVSGLGRLIGPPDEIARQLAHAVSDAGVQANVALGKTQTIARVLAHAAETGHGLTPGACGRCPWTHLPVHMLQELETLPPAMNQRDRARPYETFDRWGIVTVADLAALPAADVSSRLGRRGLALQRLARGLDLRPFVPDPETPRFTGRLELDWPIDSLEPLSFVFARLLDPLSAALERADRGAVAVRLELRLTDRSTCTRVLPLPAPMRDARVLRTLLLLHLESHPPSSCDACSAGVGETGSTFAGVDVVSIELDPAPARITRFSLFERALPSPETLSTLTARLSALVGESRVGSAVLLDSHAPDAFEMRRFAPDGPPGSATATAGLPKLSEGGKVERTGGVAGIQPALRRQRMPPAIRVAVERGRPVHIASSRRGIPYGAFAQAAGPWRSSGGWWTERSWSRNEWDVALTGGTVCRIYQDRTTDRWFLDGVYD